MKYTYFYFLALQHAASLPYAINVINKFICLFQVRKLLSNPTPQKQTRKYTRVFFICLQKLITNSKCHLHHRTKPYDRAEEL